MAVRKEYVAGLYRDLLVREGSEGEIAGHINNPGGEQGLYDFFKSSPEYTSAHGGTAGWHDQGGQVVQGPPKPPRDPIIWNVTGDDPETRNQPPIIGGGDGSGTKTVVPPTATVAPSKWFTGPSQNAFAADNFFNPQMQSVKYKFARIAADYPSNPAGLQALVNDPRFKAAFPNAKLVGKDGIDFGGVLSDGATGSPVGYIDVGQGFDEQSGTGVGWWWGHGGPSGATGAGGGSGGGASSTVNDIRSVFQSLPPGTNFSGPGDAGITNGPLQQVGQDPFSTLITNALAGLIQNQGKTDMGNSVNDAIMALVGRGGELDQGQINRRYESARELMDKGRRTQVNDLRGDLASRNLLSEPGIPQGAEIGGLERITENIAPEFSRALRDIYTDESAKADTRLMSSLSMAMGVSSEQARTMLAALGEGTNRQAALADIALRNLAQNQAWSQFLASFGLERDKVMYEIQNGQIDQIMPILQAFLQLQGMANQGYV